MGTWLLANAALAAFVGRQLGPALNGLRGVRGGCATLALPAEFVEQRSGHGPLLNPSNLLVIALLLRRKAASA